MKLDETESNVNTRQHRRIFWGVCVCAECRQSRLVAAVVAAAQLVKTPIVCLVASRRLNQIEPT